MMACGIMGRDQGWELFTSVMEMFSRVHGGTMLCMARYSAFRLRSWSSLLLTLIFLKISFGCTLSLRPILRTYEPYKKW
ncbi:hypothetical protein LINPERPRIM_LOCUS23033 [Linum perenne]